MKRDITIISINILLLFFIILFKSYSLPILFLLLLSNIFLAYSIFTKNQTLKQNKINLEECFKKYKTLEDDEKLKNEAFHMMIHDLKSPLVFMKGSVELMLEGKGGKLTKEQRDLLEMVLRGCNRVLTMIGNILDLDKIKGGKYTLNKEVFNLKKFIEEEAKLFRKKCEIYGKKFILKINIDDNLKIAADKRLLSRVFENLISNAIRHSSRENGLIELEVNYKKDEKCFYFSFYNNGEKIDEKLKKEIFKKYTLSSYSYNKGGSGLGLYFCKTAINLHNGEIWIDDNNREGTTFKIKLCS